MSYIPTSSQTSLPPWHYEKPADLANAEAMRWDVAGSRLLPRCAPNAPFAMSTNGESLAYLDFNRMLRVVDLNSDRSSIFSLASPPRKLSFSPDNRKLIFETDAQPSGLGVIDLNNSNIAYLPQPSGDILPDGDLVWFSPTEVLFQTHITARQILDLDSLEIHEPSSSPTWSKMSEADQSHWSAAQRLALPTTPHCSFEIRPQITWVSNPNSEGHEWRVNQESELCIKDAAHDYRQFCRLNARIDDQFIAAPDGSKVIRVRGNDVLAFYFKTRPATNLVFNLAMSKPIDRYPDKDKLAAAVSAQDLCAFVYGPLLNPLNHKPIGPNHGYVKGIVRFYAWSGTQAKAWLTEEFSSIGADDIIADLHVWKDNHPQLISDPETERWWSKASNLSEHAPRTVTLPPSQNTRPLDHAFVYYLSTESNALVVKNIDSDPPSGKHSDSVSFTSSAPLAPTPQQVPQEQGRLLDPSESNYQVIAQFIATHHAKANRGDLNGLVTDYANTVSYFKNGTVDRSFIFRDESLSRAKFRGMSENIVYPISIRELSPQRYQAHYQLAFDAIKSDNRRVNGKTDVYLTLEATPNGLQIVSQKSKL